MYKHASIKGDKDRIDDCNNQRLSKHFEIKILSPEFNKISEYSNFQNKISFIQNSIIKKNLNTSNAFNEENFEENADGQGQEILINSKASSIHLIRKQE